MRTLVNLITGVVLAIMFATHLMSIVSAAASLHFGG